MDREVHDEARLTDSVSVASRHYLASEHLWTALHNARRSREVEVARSGKTAFSPEHRSCVITAILSSVAFLEALVNEVFEDAVDSIKRKAISSRIEPLGVRCVELMGESWTSTERSLGAVDKYQMALLFAGKPRFEVGQYPCQDVVSVIAI